MISTTESQLTPGPARSARHYVLAFLLLVLPTPAAATVPPGFTATAYVSGLSNPTAMEFAPDGRLFVCQQGGSLRVIKGGTLLNRSFVSLTVDDAGERGLLGVAFDPAFASNNYVYVYYTATTPAAHNRVSRFTASGDTALAGSEVVLLDIDNLSSATNHNGGAIHFGPDGKLYIGIGDNANGANSQSMTTLLGKILRINPNGTIPTDNPFFLTATGTTRAIWCLGLRNPFTFAFQPGTGRLFINEVGQSSWEEIDYGMAGANYGWPATEGYTTNPLYVGPVFSYPHGAGTSSGDAIAGGAFYNPNVQQFPGSYAGKYFFGDYVNGWVNLLSLSDSSVTNFASSLGSVVDLKLYPDGSLYVLTTEGIVTRITYSSTGVGPQAGAQPTTFALAQNYPNPFNPSTTIRFTVPADGRVLLKIFNLLGAEIAKLVDERKAAGTYDVTFRAETLPSGVYLYQLSAGQALQTRRMILIR
jgi:glucose/arabinose dehydrogenase